MKLSYSLAINLANQDEKELYTVEFSKPIETNWTLKLYDSSGMEALTKTSQEPADLVQCLKDHVKKTLSGNITACNLILSNDFTQIVAEMALLVR